MLHTTTTCFMLRYTAHNITQCLYRNNTAASGTHSNYNVTKFVKWPRPSVNLDKSIIMMTTCLTEQTTVACLARMGGSASQPCSVLVAKPFYTWPITVWMGHFEGLMNFTWSVGAKKTVSEAYGMNYCYESDGIHFCHLLHFRFWSQMQH